MKWNFAKSGTLLQIVLYKRISYHSESSYSQPILDIRLRRRQCCASLRLLGKELHKFTQNIFHQSLKRFSRNLTKLLSRAAVNFQLLESNVLLFPKCQLRNKILPGYFLSRLPCSMYIVYRLNQCLFLTIQHLSFLSYG